MGTTSANLPYPEESDPVMDGATAIQALAEAVGMRTQCGRGTVTTNANGDCDVPYPVPFKNGTFPSVSVFNAGGGGTGVIISIYDSNSTSAWFSMNVKLANGTPYGGPITIHWIAVGSAP